jgi:hypothetical protein
MLRFKLGELALVIPCPDADVRLFGKVVQIIQVGPMMVNTGWEQRPADYRISVEGDPHWYCMDSILLKFGDPDEQMGEHEEENLELEA